MRKSLLFITLITAFQLLSGCRQDQTEGLGKVAFPVSGKAAAKPFFERGLLLLHSFEYEDAQEAFRQARNLDPSMVMAYWGEAMCHNHPLWREQDYGAARKILGQLGSTADERHAKATTPLEKDLLKSLDALFGVGEKTARDQAYATFMEQLHRKYPQNAEVAAFYALSLLGAAPPAREAPAYARAAQIAQQVLRQNPRHPGALHYLIHAYDDPAHAHLAFDAAESYAQVAPQASHALHMPSHIFVAMGMWDKAVSSNIDSYAASVRRMERKGLDHDARSYHALHWLMYAYLQQGKKDLALDILTDMERFARELPSRQARAYLAEMKGTYLAETGDWTSPLGEMAIDNPSELNIATQAVNRYAEGRRAVAEKDSDALESALSNLRKIREIFGPLVVADDLPMCDTAGINRYFPSPLDLEAAYVMEMELLALKAWAKNDQALAEEWFAKAAALEEQLNYEFGPPRIIEPAFELYGQWLLKNGRPEEAVAQFEKALRKGPNRRAALLGLQRAARQAGMHTKSFEAGRQLQQIDNKAV